MVITVDVMQPNQLIQAQLCPVLRKPWPCKTHFLSIGQWIAGFRPLQENYLQAPSKEMLFGSVWPHEK